MVGRYTHRPSQRRSPPAPHYLKGRDGDRINAVLAAAGYNFSLLHRWFEEFLRALLLLTLRRAFSPLRFAKKRSSRTTICTRDGGRAAVIHFASLFVFCQIAGRPDGFEAKAIALLRRYFRKVMVQFGQ
jgi:hypothetical protein